MVVVRAASVCPERSQRLPSHFATGVELPPVRIRPLGSLMWPSFVVMLEPLSHKAHDCGVHVL